MQKKSFVCVTDVSESNAIIVRDTEWAYILIKCTVVNDVLYTYY